MIVNERDNREKQAWDIAEKMMVAARTAPKGKGVDIIECAVVDGDDLYLAPYEGEAALAAGAFGIGEPTGRRFAAYDTIDVAVVPGLAFDQAGRRLGRGRGYYDRLLPRLRREGCRLLGLCFDFQRVAQVPVDATDVPVDEVI